MPAVPNRKRRIKKPMPEVKEEPKAKGKSAKTATKAAPKKKK